MSSGDELQSQNRLQQSRNLIESITFFYFLGSTIVHICFFFLNRPFFLKTDRQVYYYYDFRSEKMVSLPMSGEYNKCHDYTANKNVIEVNKCDPNIR